MCVRSSAFASYLVLSVPDGRDALVFRFGVARSVKEQKVVPRRPVVVVQEDLGHVLPVVRAVVREGDPRQRRQGREDVQGADDLRRPCERRDLSLPIGKGRFPDPTLLRNNNNNNINVNVNIIIIIIKNNNNNNTQNPTKKKRKKTVALERSKKITEKFAASRGVLTQVVPFAVFS